MPYLYLMSLLAGYEAAFLRVGFASPNRRITWRSRLAMFTVPNIRTRAVANFRGPWIGRLAEAATFARARMVLVDYFATPTQAGGEAARDSLSTPPMQRTMSSGF